MSEDKKQETKPTPKPTPTVFYGTRLSEGLQGRPIEPDGHIAKMDGRPNEPKTHVAPPPKQQQETAPPPKNQQETAKKE